MVEVTLEDDNLWTNVWWKRAPQLVAIGKGDSVPERHLSCSPHRHQLAQPLIKVVDTLLGLQERIFVQPIAIAPKPRLALPVVTYAPRLGFDRQHAVLWMQHKEVALPFSQPSRSVVEPW